MSLYLLSGLCHPFNCAILIRESGSEFSDAVIVGATVRISCPSYAWEEVGSNVEEGPGESSVSVVPTVYITKLTRDQLAAPLYHWGKT